MKPTPAHVVLIGLGSNIDPERNVPRALALLDREFDQLSVSTLYRTRPLEGREQSPYVNGVVAASTVKSLAEVRRTLEAVERACNRERDPGDPYASRTMDLDLLSYDDLCDEREGMPAKDLLERDFCLIPAAELRPGWTHPQLREPLEHLARMRFPRPPNILEAIPAHELCPYGVRATRPDER